MLPVLDEGDAPQYADYRVDGGKMTEQYISRDAECSREDEEGKVRLREREIKSDLGVLALIDMERGKSHLLAKSVTNLIQVFDLQEGSRAPLLDPVLVELVVV